MSGEVPSAAPASRRRALRGLVSLTLVMACGRIGYDEGAASDGGGRADGAAVGLTDAAPPLGVTSDGGATPDRLPGDSGAPGTDATADLTGSPEAGSALALDRAPELGARDVRVDAPRGDSAESDQVRLTDAALPGSAGDAGPDGAADAPADLPPALPPDGGGAVGDVVPDGPDDARPVFGGDAGIDAPDDAPFGLDATLSGGPDAIPDALADAALSCVTSVTCAAGSFCLAGLCRTATVSTLAGPAAGGSGEADGVLATARLAGPRGITLSSSGRIYFTDSNERVRDVNGGSVSTLAGRGWTGFLDGAAGNALFHTVTGIAVDSNGVVFVADRGNHRIRRIGGGSVSTFAGGGPGYVDGAATEARFMGPVGIAVDAANGFIVSDVGNGNLRRVLADGSTSTLVSGGAAPLDGPFTTARTMNPYGVDFDEQGRVVFTELLRQLVRRADPAAMTLTTLAGSDTAEGSADGQGAAARFRYASGVAVGTDKNIYVADRRNHLIRRVTPTGAVTTFAGSFSGSQDGPRASATFNLPAELAFDSAGTNLYVADEGNHRIRRISLQDNQVTTVVGAGVSGQADGPAAAATFSGPLGLDRTASGRIYIGESRSHLVRILDRATSTISRAAGSGEPGLVNGVPAAARFNEVWGVRVAAEGELILVDKENGCLRSVKAGAVTTLAATPPYSLNDPYDVLVLPDGRLVVAEQEAHKLHIIDATRTTMTLLAGGPRGNADGTGAAARFFDPSGLALDRDGSILVADHSNHLIRRVTLAGVVTTIAGSTVGSADGSALTARFDQPRGLVVGPGGEVYITERGTIRLLENGYVSTVAGDDYLGSADGPGPTARFFQPSGIVLDSDGSLIIADTGNHALRRVTIR
jgi:DNA-binding beta-propeller fold protein YncE